ncbi:MAG: SPFH domain-containing protein [Chloroflexota bacterium]
MDENTSIFQRPLFKRLIQLFLFLAIYIVVGFVLPTTDPKADHSFEIMFDLVLFLLGMVGWLIFFAQFVLPVSKVQDRFRVIERLVTYLLGGHGPAIFVENGFAHANAGESKKKGKGVIWLDSASAAILRTNVRFNKTIGPGVHFTKPDEYIAATADLHTLTQSIGPLEADEPFIIKETDPTYKAVKERADATTAMTRDGITIAASISVNFRIKSNAGEGNTQFGFNEKNAHTAIRDSMIREAKLDQPVWNTLPARMVADIWREYVGKFRINELFEVVSPRTVTTAQFINDMLKKRLTHAEVNQLDAFGKLIFVSKYQEQDYPRLLEEKNLEAAEKLPVKISSTEYAKLTEMGLEIKSVTIKRLFFAPDIEEQLINQWTALWLNNAQKEREQVDSARQLSANSGQQRGLKDFALNTSRKIARQTSSTPAQALELLLEATADDIKQNPALFKRLNAQLEELSKISTWLKNMRGPSA